MKKQFNIIKPFLRKLFTNVNFEKFIVIFIIGILSRFFLDKSANYYSLSEFIIYTFSFCSLNFIPGLNYLFKEIIEYISYKICNSNITTTTFHINQLDKSNNHQYDFKNEMTTIQPSQLSNCNIDFEARKKITSQIFEEIAQPTKYREVSVPSNNTRGEIYIGIKYYYKPRNAHGLYVKFHDLFNQEHIWHVWEKDSSYLRFSDLRHPTCSKLSIWKEINKATGTNVFNEVRSLLDIDAFHMNKSNK